ncbi:hydrogenase formation protein HypD [Consotaella salsifontis]|uniref:Hydrogenase maturation factor n=1 Tax=Consotaella salsifontis TaxID=1365950 RepID=A0A1T4RBS6_9HYPH|nr:hydrogenase formation protein HypD [Consotaella salsifontis]SKA13512.1 hydrogenase expression/formation protein HypD [Consotaella salsifontis]
MKYASEFRDGALARGIAATIAAECRSGAQYTFMEFCGGHTHTIARYGLEELLPGNVRLVHGPGCPVCVLPVGRVDSAIELARDHDVILCSYGDMMRVPGSHRMSLIKARAEGADIRMVWSTLDALKIARQNPGRQVAFLAIGFETTTPPTAMALKMAKAEKLDNFSIFCNHVLTPAAMRAILDGESLALQGIIGPGHVSAVIGIEPYQEFADRGQAIVVAGFEPLDLLQAILMLVRQVNEGVPRVENAYVRALPAIGNAKAREVIAETMTLRGDFEWRGLGTLPNSALRIADDYEAFDAEKRFALPYRQVPDPKSCACAEVVRGLKRPEECVLFGKVCTPDNPIGSCMVSSEGGCAAHWLYGRHRKGGASQHREVA